MAKGLNSEFEFGATSKSEFIAEHRFAWKASELVMILFMIVLGTVLAVFVQPMLMGFAFIFSSAWLAHVNQTKKKQSILQLFNTPEGLKLYHNGKLIEEASDRRMNLPEVKEIAVTNRGDKDYVLLKGEQKEDISPYIKMPIRLLEAPEFAEAILNLASGDPNITINQKVKDIALQIINKKGK
jgi:hypothetical protein